eukprot:c18329_g1_i2 orf=3-413(+)
MWCLPYKNSWCCHNWQTSFASLLSNYDSPTVFTFLKTTVLLSCNIQQLLRNKGKEENGDNKTFEEKERKLTYVWSWRTKLEKLLCLKKWGRRHLEKMEGSQTTKLLLVELQEMMALVWGSSTMSYVLLKKGGGKHT